MTLRQTLIEYQLRRVDDAGLNAAPCERFARAVIAGTFPLWRLEGVLDLLDRHRRLGTLRGTPAAYYIGTMNHELARRDLNGDSDLRVFA